MNRRRFLYTGGTTAMVATGGLGILSRELSAQATPNLSIYNAATAAASIAAGNAVLTGTSASDWSNLQNTMVNCTNEWLANGRDAGVKAAVANISPSMVTSSRLDKMSILNNIQLYKPGFTAANLQSLLNFVDVNSTMVPNALSTIQVYGMSYHMKVASAQSGKIAAGLSNGTIKAAALVASPHFSPEATAHPDVVCCGCTANGSDGPGCTNGGSGYNCKTDGANLLLAGLAFTTLSIMTLGSVDVLAGAAWSGIALWGGIGTGGWGAAHFVGCGL